MKELFTKLMQNKKALFLIVGGVAVVGITGAAIYFSSGSNLKGALQLKPIKIGYFCYGTPAEGTLPEDPKQSLPITWKTNIPGIENFYKKEWTFPLSGAVISQAETISYYQTAGTKTATFKYKEDFDAQWSAPLTCSVEVKNFSPSPGAQILINSNSQAAEAQIPVNSNSQPAQVQAQEMNPVEGYEAGLATVNEMQPYESYEKQMVPFPGSEEEDIGTEESSIPQEESFNENADTSEVNDQLLNQPTEEYHPVAESQNETYEEASEATLKPALDVMSCIITTKTFYATGSSGLAMRCNVNQEVLVSGMIVKGNFNPKEELENDALVKTLLSDKSKKGSFSVTWNGKDDYDTLADAGDYSFVVFARKDQTYAPDYSIQKFELTDEPPPPVKNETQAESSTNSTASTPQVQPSDAYQAPNVAAAPAAPPKPSKCPGVNLPTDIAGHWGEQVIIKAVDLCIMTGFNDGTFRPDRPVTRAQAARIVVAAVGGKPHPGCKDVHCGANYQSGKIWTDIREPWEGAWLRTARDLNVYFGFADGTSGAEKPITRGEAVMLVARALSTVSNFRLHQGCYTANCGAGQPNNIFIDIRDDMAWLGPALRALSDAAPDQIIRGKAPFIFDPNSSITRAELTKIIMKARELILQQP